MVDSARENVGSAFAFVAFTLLDGEHCGVVDVFF